MKKFEMKRSHHAVSRIACASALNLEKTSMKKRLLNVAAATALAFAGAAHAVPTQVNFGFIPIGNISYTGVSLGTSSMIDFGTSTFVTNTIGLGQFQDDSGAFAGMVVNLSQTTFSYIIGQTLGIDFTKTFTTGPGGAVDSQGLYTSTFTSIHAETISADFLALTFEGSVAGPGGFAAADTMLVNCNQSGGGGLVTNCSFTEQAPPRFTEVPEPASIALLGAGILGLLSTRRRKPAAVAA